MQSSITKLVAGLLMLVMSTVHAQQAANAPRGVNPTGPNAQVSNDARGPMPTQDDRIRYNQSQFSPRLPARALDPHKGTIYWPAALMTPEFNQHRARLEQLFHARSKHNSGLASHNYLEIKDETDSMLITLQERVSERDPMIYLHARKFIISVGFEGRFVSDNDRGVLRNGTRQPLLR